MSATFDATTTAEYAAASTAAARSALIVAALTGTISVKVFNGSNVEMGSGTMDTPWATASGDTVTVGEVTSFTVGTTATPDADWYIRFQNAGVTRWVRGSFGLSSSSQDFTWSLGTWTATHTGTIGTATITTSGNTAPAFTVAPTSASIAATGGTIQFTAVDPDGDSVVYSLTTTRPGITINSTTGLVTVTSAAAATSGNIVVQASDGSLTASSTCAVQVLSVEPQIRWHPGQGIRTGEDSNGNPEHELDINQMADSAEFGHALLMLRWGRMNPTGSTYDWSLLDTLIAYGAARGYRTLVQVQWKGFGTTPPTNIVPDDLDAYVSIGANGTSYIAHTWNPIVMDRFITFIQAMGARYNGNANFEGVTWSESAFSVTPQPVPAATYATQLKRLYLAAKGAFPNCNVFANMNTLTGQIPELMEYAYQNGLGYSGPDAQDCEGTAVCSANVFRGLLGATRDYRGLMPCMLTVSTEAYARYPNAAAVVDWLQTEGVTHTAWRPGYDWWDAVIAAIEADPDVATNCPVSYNGECAL